jgi:nucleoside-diphosphate-sugar epimerase
MTEERVLITGGVTDIGAACDERCEADGYKVTVIVHVGDGLIVALSDTNATPRALAHTPGHRLGTPNDTAYAASYALSGFVSGQMPYVFRGMTSDVVGV